MKGRGNQKKALRVISYLVPIYLILVTALYYFLEDLWLENTQTVFISYAVGLGVLLVFSVIVYFSKANEKRESIFLKISLLISLMFISFTMIILGVAFQGGINHPGVEKAITYSVGTAIFYTVIIAILYLIYLFGKGFLPESVVEPKITKPKKKKSSRKRK